MAIELAPEQIKAIKETHNGSIIRGDVGSGKSRTALAYFYTRVAGGSLCINGEGVDEAPTNPVDCYIITTAKKRDKYEWETEALDFNLANRPEASIGGVTLIVDSWNRIADYADVEGGFFIFDEQRLVGSGAWVKAFLKIAKHNQWILLSATPGDTWIDYAPIFVANGFYKNLTEFRKEHVVYSRFSKYPKIDRYIGTGRLAYYRDKILVEMPLKRHTTRHDHHVSVGFDIGAQDRLVKDRWNIYEDQPIRDVAELFRLMRRLVNSDPSRLEVLRTIHARHPRLIVFYNFNFELEALRILTKSLGCAVAEWNGQKHEEIPNASSWVYLVQYTAGAEGWNCTSTDTMVFFSLNYSYRIMEQSKGRIDRRNTPYIDLNYYTLKSDSIIDKAIWKALTTKKNFNEKKFEKEMKWSFAPSVRPDVTANTTTASTALPVAA